MPTPLHRQPQPAVPPPSQPMRGPGRRLLLARSVGVLAGLRGGFALGSGISLAGAGPADGISAPGPMRWLLSPPLKNDQGAPIDDTPPERVIRYLQAHWTDQPHEILRANGPRSLQMLRAGEPYCHASMVRSPQREALLLFSTTAMTPPPSLIIQRARLRELPRNAAGEVDLVQLLHQGQWRGALVSGRSYGLVVDGLLRALGPENKTPGLSFYSPRDYGARMLNMLERDRADYTIEYEWILRSPGTSERASADLVALPIQGATQLTPSGIACPRNAWGRAAIARIDRILSSREAVEMLKQAHDIRFTAELRRRYGPQLEQFYRQRAQPQALP